MRETARSDDSARRADAYGGGQLCRHRAKTDPPRCRDHDHLVVRGWPQRRRLFDAGRALLQGLPRNCLDSGAHLSLGQIGIDAPMECTGRAYTAVTASALVVGTAILISAILFYGS